LVERLRDLIDAYNAGSFNVDEMLRRLQSLSRQLSEDEQRTVKEGLSEAELAVFDLLTKPDPALSGAERDRCLASDRHVPRDRIVAVFDQRGEDGRARTGFVRNSGRGWRGATSGSPRHSAVNRDVMHEQASLLCADDEPRLTVGACSGVWEQAALPSSRRPYRATKVHGCPLWIPLRGDPKPRGSTHGSGLAGHLG